MLMMVVVMGMRRAQPPPHGLVHAPDDIDIGRAAHREPALRQQVDDLLSHVALVVVIVIVRVALHALSGVGP
ncbi:hypothetical protein D3C87_1848410 [compost metagenome]